MDMDLSITFQPGTAPQLKSSGREGWWDAVGGVRGRYDFTDHILLAGTAGVGGGSSKLTWQAQAALGYQFNKMFAMTMGYRYLDYDYKNGDFAYDVVTQGFYVGLGFHLMRWDTAVSTRRTRTTSTRAGALATLKRLINSVSLKHAPEASHEPY